MSINLLIHKPKISTLKKVQIFRNTNQAVRLPSELISLLEEILLGDYDTIYSENRLRNKALNEGISDSIYTIKVNISDNVLNWESYLLMISGENHNYVSGFIYALLKAYDFKYEKERTHEEIKIINNMINFMIFNDSYSSLLFDEILDTLPDFFTKSYIQNSTKAISNYKKISNYRYNIEDYIKHNPNYEIVNITKMDKKSSNYFKYYTLKRINNPVPININELSPEFIMKDGKLTISEQIIDENNLSYEEIIKINDSLRAIEIINEYINIYIDTHSN